MQKKEYGELVYLEDSKEWTLEGEVQTEDGVRSHHSATYTSLTIALQTLNNRYFWQVEAIWIQDGHPRALISRVLGEMTAASPDARW